MKKKEHRFILHQIESFRATTVLSLLYVVCNISAHIVNTHNRCAGENQSISQDMPDIECYSTAFA